MFKTGNTNRQVIDGMRSIMAGAGHISDDSSVSSRFILYHLLRIRSYIIKEKWKARDYLSKFNLQTIPCIPLEEVDQAECPCTPMSGCTFLRTRMRIPVPITDFRSVTSIDGQITYTYVEWDKFKYKLQSRIRANQDAPYYTFKTHGDGTYLYVHNDIHKKYITTTAPFENPIDVQLFPSCDEDINRQIKCKRPLDLEFILDPNLFALMQELFLAKIYRLQNPVADNRSDDADDATQTNKMNIK